jgi:hypothetical protein
MYVIKIEYLQNEKKPLITNWKLNLTKVTGFIMLQHRRNKQNLWNRTLDQIFIWTTNKWQIAYYSNIGWFKIIVDKYGNYVRKFMWQLCGWGRIDIFLTFHKRAFDFFLYHCTLIWQFSKLRDYELSKKCQLYGWQSCHIYFRT